MELQRSSGIVLHPTSLPGGTLGGRLRVRRLARRGGPELVAGAAARTRPTRSAHPTPRRPRSPAGRASSPSRGHRSRHRTRPPSGAPTATGSTTGRDAGGTIADQVRFEREWSTLREYARERGIRVIGDVPIYVAQESVDHLTHPELFLDGRRRRRAARQARPDGAALGQPALRLGCGRSRGLPLVDRAAATHVRALRPRPDRPLPRLRGLLGDPRGRPRARCPHRSLAARARRGALPRRRGGARASCP